MEHGRPAVCSHDGMARGCTQPSAVRQCLHEQRQGKGVAGDTAAP